MAARAAEAAAARVSSKSDDELRECVMWDKLPTETELWKRDQDQAKHEKVAQIDAHLVSLPIPFNVVLACALSRFDVDRVARKLPNSVYDMASSHAWIVRRPGVATLVIHPTKSKSGDPFHAMAGGKGTTLAEALTSIETVLTEMSRHLKRGAEPIRIVSHEVANIMAAVRTNYKILLKKLEPALSSKVDPSHKFHPFVYESERSPQAIFRPFGRRGPFVNFFSKGNMVCS